MVPSLCPLLPKGVRCENTQVRLHFHKVISYVLYRDLTSASAPMVINCPVMENNVMVGTFVRHRLFKIKFTQISTSVRISVSKRVRRLMLRTSENSQ